MGGVELSARDGGSYGGRDYWRRLFGAGERGSGYFGPRDDEVGVVFDEHFGVADYVDGEGVRAGGLEFGEALAFEMETFVLAVKNDTEFVRAGRKRVIDVQSFSRARDGERRSGDEMLVGEDG